MSSSTCKEFCCSAFARPKDEQLTDLPLLTTGKHQIFRPKNFPDNVDRAALDQSLRLATLFLQTDPMVLYIYTLFEGEIKDQHGTIITDLASPHAMANSTYLSIWPKERHEQVTLAMRRRVEVILKNMVDMVTFQIQPKSDDATCRPLYGRLPDYLRKHFPRGCRSIVRLSKRSYETLVHHHHHSDHELVYTHDCGAEISRATELLEDRFGMAMETLHEFVHVLNNAAFGSCLAKRREIAYKDHLLAEAGFDAEYLLLGATHLPEGLHYGMISFKGCARACQAATERIPVLAFHLSEWPSCDTCHI